jgi:hypothetical protein
MESSDQKWNSSDQKWNCSGDFRCFFGPLLTPHSHLDNLDNTSGSKTKARKKKKEKRKKKNYSTEYSHVVPHHSTDSAIKCLTAQIGRDAVVLLVYGRNSKVRVSGWMLIITPDDLGPLSIHHAGHSGAKTEWPMASFFFAFCFFAQVHKSICDVIPLNNSYHRKKEKKERDVVLSNKSIEQWA